MEGVLSLIERTELTAPQMQIAFNSIKRVYRLRRLSCSRKETPIAMKAAFSKF